MSKICEWLNDRFDKIWKKELEKTPEKPLNKIVCDSFPDPEELMNTILEWYDKKDILECFDSDELLDACDEDDILDRAKGTYEWDSELEAEVDAEISSRDLITWDDAHKWLEDELLKKPQTYRDMTPDDLWETVCNLLEVNPYNVDGIENGIENMLDKMTESSFSHEIQKNVAI